MSGRVVNSLRDMSIDHATCLGLAGFVRVMGSDMGDDEIELHAQLCEAYENPTAFDRGIAAICRHELQRREMVNE